MPSLASAAATADTQLPHHHLTPFDFAACARLPDAYTWTDADADVTGNLAVVTADDAIPIVDLADPDAAGVIGRACEQWGIFLLTGHGVSPDLLAGVDDLARRLFELPAQEKLKVARSASRVASGYGPPPFAAFFSKLMWSEGFTVPASPADDAEKLWPADYQIFCDIMEEYAKAMKRLSGLLLHLMLRSLAGGDAGQAVLTEGSAVGRTTGTVHLNSYPPCPEPGRAMGLAPHTDSGLLTILYQNAVPGLQVLRPDDQLGQATRWVGVQPPPQHPDALIVNVGDLMHVASNGRYRSVVHRAVVNRTSHRISVGYFCGPEDDAKVLPLVRQGDRPMFRGVTWPEYLGLRKKMFDKALEAIKVEEDESA